MKLKPFKPLPVRKVIGATGLSVPSWVPLDEMKASLEKNKAGIAAGAVIAVILTLFVILYVRHRIVVGERSSALFQQAQRFYMYRVPREGGEVNAPVTSEEEKYQRAQQMFQQLLDTYPGSRLAPAALVYLGNSSYKLRQYTSALEAYDKFITNYPRHEFAPEINAARGDCLEQLGRHKEALESYRKAMKSKSPVAYEASLGGVRCLLKLVELDKQNQQMWWDEARRIIGTVGAGEDGYGKRAAKSIEKLLMDFSQNTEPTKEKVKDEK